MSSNSIVFSINYCLVPNNPYIRNADSETREFFYMLTHNIAALVMQLKYSIYHIETFKKTKVFSLNFYYFFLQFLYFFLQFKIFSHYFKLYNISILKSKEKKEKKCRKCKIF